MLLVNKIWIFFKIVMHFQEAKQALEMMGRWEMIDVCDALELLSPVFEREEVGVNYLSFIAYNIQKSYC